MNTSHIQTEQTQNTEHIENIPKTNLEEKHPFFMNLWFCFYIPFVCRIKPLVDIDIYDVQTNEKCCAITKRIEMNWRKRYEEYILQIKQKEIAANGEYIPEPNKPSLLKVLLSDLGSFKLIVAILILIPSIGFQVCQPSLMREVMKQVMIKATMPELAKFPYAAAIILIFCPFLRIFLDSLAFRLIIHFSSDVRSSLAGLIYKKSLSLNISANNDINTGRLISLISIDIQFLGEFIPYFFQMILVPIQIFVPFGFVCYYWGACSLIFFGVMAIIIPLQIFFSMIFIKYMNGFLTHGDERNKITNETLLGMRAVKMSGLEKIFIEHIEEVRNKQLNDIFLFTFWYQMSIATLLSAPSIVNSTTIATYIFSKNIPQSMFAVEILPTMGFLAIETVPFSQLGFYLQALGILAASQARIRDFLILPELKKVKKNLPSNTDLAVEIINASFGWNSPIEIPISVAEKQEMKKEQEKRKQQIIENDSVGKKKFQSKTLKNITFSLPKGSLTMVIGAVGSGKSSLGSVLIGDIELMSNNEDEQKNQKYNNDQNQKDQLIQDVKGEVRIDGSIAYCPQIAWINNNTIRGNITFGSEYEEKKYNDVVRVCALEQDFQTFAAGDQTAIGEKGVNLSGGQKARIQLARAVYSDRDIYILDDPLSAVDAHVGKILFEECIDGRSKGKTRMLMTNQLQYIDLADNVILLRDKKIFAQGTTEELKKKGISFEEFIVKGGQKKDKKAESNKKGQQDEKLNKNELIGNEIEKDEKKQNQKENEEITAKQIISEEEQDTGAVTWGSYMDYMFKLASKRTIIFFILIIGIVEVIVAFSNWWIGIVGNETRYPKISYYWKIGIYALLAVGNIIFCYMRSTANAFANRRSSKIIHSNLLKSIAKCPSSFFDTTPLGRIINRFSGDLTQCDQWLYAYFNWVIQLWLDIVGQIIIVAVDTPWFLIIGVPSLVVFYIMMVLYRRAALNIMRLSAMSRSPVLSHFGETVTGAGLSTIRAYQLENQWIQKFEEFVDKWNIRMILVDEGIKWASLYTSVISSVFMAGVVLIGWNLMNASLLGVAIASAVQFAEFGLLIVEQNVQLESKMTSFDRIRFYSSKLPQEKSETNPVDPPQDWPLKGQIQYDSVTFRYRSGLPYVLRNVSFVLQGGEKIGVCGRTGAGKSSLLFALFRLIELDPKLQPTMIDVTTGFPIEIDPNEEPNKGRVLIDGFDISKVDLSRLRSSIAIIPQDPTLFTGTLRYNLDLAGKCNDDRIWEVLSMIEMQEAVANLPLALDSQVAEGGSNFSAGQRQLICFGRAILNSCRIVVMDEATASVDVETDSKIQKTIREQFVDKTVIVIAHRLHTIMNSDRIMVIADGKVAEIDTPENLKANSDSAFNSLIKSLG
ncbi:MAG: ABC transporter: Multidrug resistance-associated protein, ATP binding protein [Streblomastix strix]|uniref:ABC transporter: Multidrug resistance-associated protein, ATP binding protein n=1 Tax=Streblomastix strix TaxID=222440 RepID=A0A5J4WRD8_9EUKA|nr:MAG: ABC transporter: Multidrug resistance-associated protein, ATP binding protein [Streblomastix strix]